MKTKAIATHTLVLIAMMGLFLFFTIIIFWQWISLNKIETNKATCTAKLLNYCQKWFVKNFDDAHRPDWDNINPQGCEEFGIYEPDKDDCKNLI